MTSITTTPATEAERIDLTTPAATSETAPAATEKAAAHDSIASGSVQPLEERVTPRLAANHNETML